MPLFIYALVYICTNLLLMTGATLKELPLEGLHDLLVNANLELIKAMGAKDSIGIAAKTKHIQVIIDAIVSKKEIAKHISSFAQPDKIIEEKGKRKDA
jgi:hypothetical protein